MGFSLKYRIAVIIFVLEAILMGIVLWQTLGHSEEVVRNQLDKNDRAILEIMSGISRTALLTEEYADLQTYLENLLETSRIEQALLVDSRGLIVVSSRPDAIGKPPVEFNAQNTHDAAVSRIDFWRSKEIKNSGGLLGQLAIQVSNEALIEATIESRNLGIGIAMAGMVIIAVVGLITGGLLTRRLVAVTVTADRFSHGQLEARTGIQGRDEIGVLGETFDRMAGNLQTSQQEGEALIKQLSEKNVQMERFTYTVSHDLKTPLVTVRNFAGMLEKDIAEGNTTGIKKDLDYILSGTESMANLLEDLLKLSQIGHVINDPRPVGLNKLFAQAEKDLHSIITEQGAFVEIQPDMPVVYADSSRLLEVAHNLLQNALKYSRSGQQSIIKVTAENQGDETACCVSDNGIGIDPQYHELIFGLFNRLDQSYEGTGVGLTLVKDIIETHGGSISVESLGEGTGSKFCFTLPTRG
jgi:signal transduction histidine kinase